MKKLLFFILVSVPFITAQVNFQGNISSSVYSYETPSESRLDLYQGLYFKITPHAYPNISFHSYVKAIYDGDPQEMRYKVNHSYLRWKMPQNNIDMRIGRQFVYAGVINGTLDALLFSISPVSDLKIKILAGIVTPFDRANQFIKWSDGNALGAYGSYQFDKALKADISYFQKERDSDLYWQQAGIAFTGLVNDIFYRIKYDQNLLSSEYQQARAHLTYYLDKWSFSAEFNSSKPRIYEDSFFSRFKIKEHNQLRLGITHELWDYQVGTQFINTSYPEDESTNQFTLSFGKKWAVLGLLYQTGFGGENAGVYAQVDYNILSNLSFNLYSSHYRYERQSLDIEEQATAFSAGVQYKPVKTFKIDAQIQESINSFYKSDIRGLLRLNYMFNF